MMSHLLHREEGQEGEEEPVDPLRPTREKERTHSKTKKTRRERRHAERGAETTSQASPSVAEQQQQVGEEQEMQVTSDVTKSRSLRNSMQ